MASTRGPLFSLGASGTFGSAITFLQNAKRVDVRIAGRGTTGKSPKQESQRAAFEGCAALWSLLDTANKFAWYDAKDDPNVTYWNHFLRVNLNRWQQGLAPIGDPIQHPEIGCAPIAVLERSSTKQGIKLRWIATEQINDTNFWAFFTEEQEPERKLINARFSTPFNLSIWDERIWTPPRPGLWWPAMTTSGYYGEWGELLRVSPIEWPPIRP